MGKKILALIFACIMCVGIFAACSSEIAGEPVQYDDIKSLSEAVNFQVRGPSVLPDGYALAGYFAIKDKIAEILFVKGDEELIFAMTKAKKIETDFGAFEDVSTVELGGNSFEFSKNGELVYLAVTQKDGMSYAVYAKDGISVDDMTLIAQNMFITDEKPGDTDEAQSSEQLSASPGEQPQETAEASQEAEQPTA